MVDDEIVRGTIHQHNQLPTFVNDGYALPPGQGCSPKAHDLYILLQRKLARYNYRIVLDELRTVVLGDFSVEEGFNVGNHNSD